MAVRLLTIFVCIAMLSCSRVTTAPEARGRLVSPTPAVEPVQEEEEEFLGDELQYPEINVPDVPEVNRFLMVYGAPKSRTLAKSLSNRVPHQDTVEEIFSRYGLPVELTYLPVLESGYRTHVKSTQGAAGIWQFIPGTARRYGLKVNKKVDERLDVRLSTEAAAKYFSDLYEQFSDWYLALAAFNAGPATVERAVKRAGSKDFFVIARKGMLPRETTEFVPRFLAVTVLCRGLTPSRGLEQFAATARQSRTYKD